MGLMEEIDKAVKEIEAELRELREALEIADSNNAALQVDLKQKITNKEKELQRVKALMA